MRLESDAVLEHRRQECSKEDAHETAGLARPFRRSRLSASPRAAIARVCRAGGDEVRIRTLTRQAT
jgi:hypothetical protein